MSYLVRYRNADLCESPGCRSCNPWGLAQARVVRIGYRLRRFIALRSLLVALARRFGAT